MLQHIVTAWRIDRGCLRILEYGKRNLIQQPQMHGCCNVVRIVISSFPDNMLYHV